MFVVWTLSSPYQISNLKEEAVESLHVSVRMADFARDCLTLFLAWVSPNLTSFTRSVSCLRAQIFKSLMYTDFITPAHIGWPIGTISKNNIFSNFDFPETINLPAIFAQGGSFITQIQTFRIYDPFTVALKKIIFFQHSLNRKFQKMLGHTRHRLVRLG